MTVACPATDGPGTLLEEGALEDHSSLLLRQLATGRAKFTAGALFG
jgi:hypothetical protein